MKTESPQFLPLDSETIRDASGRDVPVADRLAECDEEMIALSTMEGDFLSNVAAVLPGVTPPGGRNRPAKQALAICLRFKPDLQWRGCFGEAEKVLRAFSEQTPSCRL